MESIRLVPNNIGIFRLCVDMKNGKSYQFTSFFGNQMLKCYNLCLQLFQQHLAGPQPLGLGGAFQSQGGDTSSVIRSPANYGFQSHGRSHTTQVTPQQHQHMLLTNGGYDPTDHQQHEHDNGHAHDLDQVPQRRDNRQQIKLQTRAETAPVNSGPGSAAGSVSGASFSNSQSNGGDIDGYASANGLHHQHQHEELDLQDLGAVAVTSPTNISSPVASRQRSSGGGEGRSTSEFGSVGSLGQSQVHFTPRVQLQNQSSSSLTSRSGEKRTGTNGALTSLQLQPSPSPASDSPGRTGGTSSNPSSARDRSDQATPRREESANDVQSMVASALAQMAATGTQSDEEEEEAAEHDDDGGDEEDNEEHSSGSQQELSGSGRASAAGDDEDDHVEASAASGAGDGGGGDSGRSSKSDAYSHLHHINAHDPLWKRLSEMAVIADAVLPVSVSGFYQRFISDHATLSVADYHSAKGGRKVTLGHWKSDEHAHHNGHASASSIGGLGSSSNVGGGRDRGMSSTEGIYAEDGIPSAPAARELRLVMPLSGPLLPAQTAVEKLQRMSAYNYQHSASAATGGGNVDSSHHHPASSNVTPFLIVDTSARSFDVPFGDYFTTEEAWLVSPAPSDSSSGSIASTGASVAALHADLPIAPTPAGVAGHSSASSSSDSHLPSGSNSTASGLVDRCRVRVFLLVRFHKGTLLRGKISSETKKSVTEFSRDYILSMRTHLANDPTFLRPTSITNMPQRGATTGHGLAGSGNLGYRGRMDSSASSATGTEQSGNTPSSSGMRRRNAPQQNGKSSSATRSSSRKGGERMSRLSELAPVTELPTPAPTPSVADQQAQYAQQRLPPPTQTPQRQVSSFSAATGVAPLALQHVPLPGDAGAVAGGSPGALTTSGRAAAAALLTTPGGIPACPTCGSMVNQTLLLQLTSLLAQQQQVQAAGKLPAGGVDAPPASLDSALSSVSSIVSGSGIIAAFALNRPLSRLEAILCVISFFLLVLTYLLWNNVPATTRHNS